MLSEVKELIEGAKLDIQALKKNLLDDKPFERKENVETGLLSESSESDKSENEEDENESKEDEKKGGTNKTDDTKHKKNVVDKNNYYDVEPDLGDNYTEDDLKGLYSE